MSIHITDELNIPLMELHSEIERMKVLTELTNKIKQLKGEIEALKQKRLSLINDYANQGLLQKLQLKK